MMLVDMLAAKVKTPGHAPLASTTITLRPAKAFSISGLVVVEDLGSYFILRSQTAQIESSNVLRAEQRAGSGDLDILHREDDSEPHEKKPRSLIHILDRQTYST